MDILLTMILLVKILSAQEIYSRRDEFGISYGRTTIYDIVKSFGDEQK